MFKEFNKTERLAARHLYNPASRTAKDEFLKSDDEITADFTYHTYTSNTEVSKISPDAVSFPHVRRIEDPVRLLMKLEATNSMEENY